MSEAQWTPEISGALVKGGLRLADAGAAAAYLNRLEEALLPFLKFLAIVEASRTLDGITEPLDDDSSVATYIGRADVAQLRVGDVRHAAAVVAGE